METLATMVRNIIETIAEHDYKAMEYIARDLEYAIENCIEAEWRKSHPTNIVRDCINELTRVINGDKDDLRILQTVRLLGLGAFNDYKQALKTLLGDIEYYAPEEPRKLAWYAALTMEENTG